MKIKKTPIIKVNSTDVINQWNQIKQQQSTKKSIRERAIIFWDKASSEEILNFLENHDFACSWEEHAYDMLPSSVKNSWIKYYKKEYCQL